ncbi:MAG: hypothetical protein J6Z44_04705, partial [Bacteroidales bacterium]|nr:hypothetical protein [Bacteroidales bacterium]
MNIRFNIRQFIGLAALLWVGIMPVVAQVYRVGDLFTAPDGSQGIVYWLNPDGSGGWVVALNDASAGCPWGETGDILGLDNQNPSDYNRQQLLLDTAGYAHTQAIRSYQNNATSTAAGVVDFAHGWYLPSPAQLSILYGQLPFIEAALGTAGGTTLTTDRYWCSAEVDGDNAWTVYCYYGNFYSYGKTSIYRVRAVRSFTYAPADGVTYAWSDGSSGSSVTVLPTGTATWSVTATSGSCEASDTATVTRCATVVPSLFDGLVAYYPFDDDDLTDHTGNGNDGTNYGTTATTDRFCREGKARNFAGVDSPQYIDVPNSSSLQFTDAATVSLWFCMNGKRGMDGWGHSTETGNNHYLFAKLWDYYKNMRTRISVLNSGEFILASEITQSCAEDTLHGLQLGQWMQATIVYTTTYIETYVNGQLVAHTDASNSFSSTNNNPLRFGMMGDDWYPMNGKLDDIRIFNRALDASEVEQLYLLDIVPQDSLLVYLPLNGNVTDYSGNGFQPVLHGNVTPTAGHLYLGDDSTAYHFPGIADSWIEIPHDDRLNLCGSFTVSAWYNRWAGWTYGNLVSKGRDIQYGWKLGTSGTNVNGSSGNDAIASSTPADGYWHLATSVYDASTSTLRYYLDGELEAEATGCGIPHATNYPVAIGRHRSYADDSPDPWPYPFKGDIDDIVIYNRPLSAEEVH